MSTKKAADYAPGLPSKSDMGHADKLRVGQMLDCICRSIMPSGLVCTTIFGSVMRKWVF